MAINNEVTRRTVITPNESELVLSVGAEVDLIVIVVTVFITDVCITENTVWLTKHSGVALTRLPILMQAESMHILNSFKLIL